MTSWRIIEGECVTAMAAMPEASIDAVVTDPPYGLSREPDIAEVLRHWLAGDDYQHRGGGFMGRSWDSFVPGPVYWREAFRVLKPGGHLVAFGGTRTYDLLSIAIRMAGFEIRDNLAWQRLDHVFCQCETARHGGDNVRGVRRDVQDMAADAASGETADVLTQLQRTPTGSGVGDAWAQGQGGVGAGGGGVVPQADERRAQPGVEGRRDAEAPEGELWRGAACSSADVGATDGASGWVHSGAPAGDGEPLRAAADQNGGGPSPGPQSVEQHAGEPGAVAVEWIAQGGGAWPGCPRCRKPLAPPFAGGPLSWEHGQGFPKSQDMERAVATATCKLPGRHFARTVPKETLPGDHVCPMTPESEPWSGFGSALKPAHEPIVLARKPFRGSVAVNVLAHGTGAINVDGCRIGGEPWKAHRATGLGSVKFFTEGDTPEIDKVPHEGGRWPANVMLGHAEGCVRVGTRRVRASDPRRADGTVNASWGTNGVYGGAKSDGMDKPGYADSDGMEEVESWKCVEGCPVRLLDEQSGTLTSNSGDPFKRNADKFRNAYGDFKGNEAERGFYGDSGGASRFFYCAKASSAERGSGNSHPTVKPVELMRWLCRLITPKGGTILDPFTGSGTTGIAALREGFAFVGIEREAEYAQIARARIIGDAPLFNSASEKAA